MEKKGIDISKWQGTPDFEKIKKSKKVDFVILKCGGSDRGCYTDAQFERNYKECKRLGIPVGVYYFVGKNFLTIKDGKADAKRLYNIIKGKKFEYPIYLDVETTQPIQKYEVTTACISFLDYLEKKGFYVGIYASDIYGFKDRLILERLEKYDKWVACYGKKPSYVKKYGMWQYSEKGSVMGINGFVDMDIATKDYPKIMKKNHKNGF